jgi:hypothetical protein
MYTYFYEYMLNKEIDELVKLAFVDLQTGEFPNDMWDLGVLTIPEHYINRMKYAWQYKFPQFEANGYPTTIKIKPKNHKAGGNYSFTLFDLLESENYSVIFPDPLGRAIHHEFEYKSMILTRDIVVLRDRSIVPHLYLGYLDFTYTGCERHISTLAMSNLNGYWGTRPQIMGRQINREAFAQRCQIEQIDFEKIYEPYSPEQELILLTEFGQ